MTWLRQAAHVAAKDGRMAWYFFVVLVPLLLLQVFQVGGDLTLLWAVLLPLLTLILVAHVVQADPAVRGEGFWITLPLGRGAVLAAKVLTAGALLGLVLAGEMIVVLRHDAAAGAGSLLLACARDEGRFLCVALAIAALTRDLRAFLLALVVAAIAWGIATTTPEFGRVQLHVSGLPPWLLPALCIAGSLAIAAYVYDTGRRAPAALATVVFLGGLVFLGAASGTRLGRAPNFGPPLARGLRPDSVLAARLVPTAAPGASVSAVRLVGGSPALEYTLGAGLLTVRLPGDSLRHLSLFPEPLTPPLTVVPGVPGARWVNVTSRSSGSFWARLFTPGQDVAALAGTPVRIDARIQATQPVLVARLPLRAGALLVRAGSRIRIVEARVPPSMVRIRLQISRVGDPGSAVLVGERLAFAVLDRAHATVYPLAQTSYSSNPTSLLGGAPHVVDQRLELPTYLQGPATAPAGPGPFELLVIDRRVVGSYHVNLPVETQVGPRS